MRVLLKSLRSGLFMTGTGRWTAKAKEALDFKCSVSAHDYCQNHRCYGTSIILKFPDSRHDIELKNC